MARRSSSAATRAAADSAPAPVTAEPTTRARGSEADALTLDRVIHERMRLGIVSALAANETLTFTELRDLMGTSDGNLSVHARKLEEAGYVTCTKEFAGRTPRTTYRLTAAGRRAFDRYLAHLEGLIAAMRESR